MSSVEPRAGLHRTQVSHYRTTKARLQGLSSSIRPPGPRTPLRGRGAWRERPRPVARDWGWIRAIPLTTTLLRICRVDSGGSWCREKVDLSLGKSAGRPPRMTERDQPFDDSDPPSGKTTACVSNSPQASRVRFNSASNAAASQSTVYRPWRPASPSNQVLPTQFVCGWFLCGCLMELASVPRTEADDVRRRLAFPAQPSDAEIGDPSRTRRLVCAAGQGSCRPHRQVVGDSVEVRRPTALMDGHHHRYSERRNSSIPTSSARWWCRIALDRRCLWMADVTS